MGTKGNYCLRIYASSLFLREKQKKAKRRLQIHYSVRAMGAETQRDVPRVCVRTRPCYANPKPNGAIYLPATATLTATFAPPVPLFPSLPSHQVLLRDPVFAALVDQRLNGTGWNAEMLANFLYNGPPDQRPPGAPPYDWRDVFNSTTQVLELLSNFLSVSTIADETSPLSSSPQVSFTCPHTHTHHRGRGPGAPTYTAKELAMYFLLFF